MYCPFQSDSNHISSISKPSWRTAHIWSVSEGNNALFIGLKLSTKCSYLADTDNRKMIPIWRPIYRASLVFLFVYHFPASFCQPTFVPVIPVDALKHIYLHEGYVCSEINRWFGVLFWVRHFLHVVLYFFWIIFVRRIMDCIGVYGEGWLANNILFEEKWMSVTKCILFVFILLYWFICINTFIFVI